MMRRIEAEERLAAIGDRAVAAGSMRPFDARRHSQRLQRAAHGGGRAKAAKATPAVLAGMGIAIVRATPAGGAGQPSAAAEEPFSDG